MRCHRDKFPRQARDSWEIFWSEETFRIFEYTPGTQPTIELIIQRVHPEDKAFVRQMIERATRDQEGNLIRRYATATDIDDRKRAEERVRKENGALREEIDKASMFEEIVGSSTALK